MEKTEGLILNIELKDENGQLKVLTMSRLLELNSDIVIEFGDHKTEITKDKLRSVLQPFMY